MRTSTKLHFQTACDEYPKIKNLFSITKTMWAPPSYCRGSIMALYVRRSYYKLQIINLISSFTSSQLFHWNEQDPVVPLITFHWADKIIPKILLNVTFFYGQLSDNWKPCKYKFTIFWYGWFDSQARQYRHSRVSGSFQRSLALAMTTTISFSPMSYIKCMSIPLLACSTSLQS